MGKGLTDELDWVILSTPRHAMTTEEEERRKATAWEGLCRENGWCCRLCGALPELGKQFEDTLCEDCRLSVKNE
jgi:hypothetical protein